jgi:ankyrin repeat protein
MHRTSESPVNIRACADKILGRFGETALHYAVRSKDAELVHFLLDRGADLSVRSRDGSPVDVADEDMKSVLTGTSLT